MRLGRTLCAFRQCHIFCPGFFVLAALALGLAARPCKAATPADLTDQLVTALQQGDTRPLASELFKGGVGARYEAALGEFALLGEPVQPYPPMVKPEDWSERLRPWIAALNKSDVFFTQSLRDDGTTRVTARFDGDDEPVYWQFHYRAGGDAPLLTRVDLPLMGATLAEWLAAETVYMAYHPRVGDGEPLAKRTGFLRNAIILLALILIAGVLIQSAQPLDYLGNPFKNRWLLFTVIGLAVFLFLLGFRQLTKAPPLTYHRQEPSTFGPVENWVLLRTHMRDGRYRLAQVLAVSLLKQLPDAQRVRVELVRALAAQKKWEQMETHLKALETDAALTAFVRHGLAEVYTASARPHLALPHLRELEGLLDGDGAILMRTARVLYAANRHAESARVLQQVFAAYPDSVEALILDARLAVERNDLPAAAADLRRVKAMRRISLVGIKNDPDFMKLRHEAEYADIFAFDPPAISH